MVNQTRVKGYAVLLSVFMLGAFAGGGTAYAVAQHRFARLIGDHPRFFETRRIGAISHRLGLDGDQRERVRAVMDRHFAERQKLEREMYERCGDALRATESQMDDEVRAVLEPDQRARYDQLAKERRARGMRGR